MRPALLKMSGRRRLTRPRVHARALTPIANPGNRRGIPPRPAGARHGEVLGARLTGEQGSAILRSMIIADGLAVIDPDTIVATGSSVEVILLRELP